MSLVGSLSVSRSYPDYTIGLIKAFCQSKYKNSELAQLVEARSPYLSQQEAQILEKALLQIHSFKDIASHLRARNFGDSAMPKLFRRYSGLNCQFLSFAGMSKNAYS